MKTMKKIIPVLFLIFVLLLGFAGFSTFYFYSHPETIKPTIEKTLSRMTGTVITIHKLSYSISPFRIVTEGIALRPVNNSNDYQIDIPILTMDIGFDGPFGKRTMIVKNLQAREFSVRLSKGWNAPEIFRSKGRPSLLSAMLRRFTALFLFSDIRFDTMRIMKGDFVAFLEDSNVRLEMIQVSLNPEGLIDLSVKVRVDWVKDEMSLVIPVLRLATDHGVSLLKPVIKGMLTIGDASISGERAKVRGITLDASIVYDHNLRELLFDSGSIDGKNILLKGKTGHSLDPFNLSGRAKGIVNLQSRLLRVSEFNFNLEDMIRLNGQLDAGFGTQSEINLKLHECRLLPEKMRLFLPKEIKEKIDPFNLGGPINILANFSVNRAGEKGRLEGEIKAGLKQNLLEVKEKQFRLKSRVSGDIIAKGIFPGMDISADIRADQTFLSGEEYLFESAGAELKLTGRYPVFVLKEFQANIPRAILAPGEREYIIDNIKLHAPGSRLDMSGMIISFPEVRLDTSLVKNLVLGIESNREKIAFHLRGRETGILKTFNDLYILPIGWKLTGVDDIEAKACLKENRYLSMVARLNFSDFSFENRDSNCMGEGLSLNISTESEIDLETSFSIIESEMEASKGEILCDRFYFNTGANSFMTSFKGVYNRTERDLHVTELGLVLKDILAINANGSMLYDANEPRLRFSLDIPRTSIKPVFHNFVYEPYKMEHPALNDFKVDGDISAELNIENDAGVWKLTGACSVKKGELYFGGENLSFRGIDLDLPIRYQTIADGLKQKEEIGGLSIQSASVHPLPEQSIAVVLEAFPNSLEVKSPTFIKVPGGEIRVGPLKINDIYSSNPVIVTDITFQDIETDPFFDEVLKYTIKGLISGSLNPVKFENNRLTSMGKIKAELFKGEILIKDPTVLGIVASSPVINLNAQWNNLDLSEITTGTPFGKVQGILKGHVKDLEIVHGQPQRFDLLLETVESRGVPQRISVKAVDNIARIGGGRSPFVGLAGSFASLFKEFPYKMIGIRASLENDVFRVNGTIKEDGLEYLIKRSGFSGVDVVNQNPDNRISFKDMIKRIMRISGSRSGPVVK